jgi:hypothetical protein
MEEENECLQPIKDLQYTDDIQDYILKMEDLNTNYVSHELRGRRVFTADSVKRLWFEYPI